MPYNIQVDFASSYELIASYSIFTKRNLTRHLLYGDQWLKETESLIGESLKNDILTFEDPGCWGEYLMLLVNIRGKENEDPKKFLKWVEGIQPGELFEFLSPHVLNPVQPQIGAMKNQFVNLLYRWNEKYFETIDHTLLDQLKVDFKKKEILKEELSPQEVVEQATDFWIGDEANLDKIILVPSIHVNPIKFIYKYNGMNIINYPVDPPVGEFQVPYRLRRITKALNDDNRVRMIQLVAQGPKTFTDLVNEIGLAKATVHQHLFVLRSAGLLRFHYYEDIYSVNPNVFEKVKSVLEGYTFGGKNKET